MRRNFFFAILAILVTYLAGGWSERHNIFPWPQMLALKHHFSEQEAPPESRYVFDSSGRLASDETKKSAACPPQSDRTAVLLVLGQSNAANHGGQQFRSEHGTHILNFFVGRCFIAQSPLLGSTGAKGEYWTRLANLLVASGRFDDIVIAPLAITGSEVSRWAEGGDINQLLIETTRQLEQSSYRVTHVFWVQGEADYVEGTGTDAYKQRFLSLVDTLRAQKVTAPVYVSIATKCLEPSNGGFKSHASDNPVSRAQMELSTMAAEGLRRGVNIDALLDEVDRYDDCHIGGGGEQKVAKAWADLLLAEP